MVSTTPPVSQRRAAELLIAGESHRKKDEKELAKGPRIKDYPNHRET
jgi:hypothetical protein